MVQLKPQLRIRRLRKCRLALNPFLNRTPVLGTNYLALELIWNKLLGIRVHWDKVLGIRVHFGQITWH